MYKKMEAGVERKGGYTKLVRAAIPLYSFTSDEGMG